MTTDFSRTYMPPGTYIEENESVVVSSSGVPPTLVAIVGQARGYQIVTEQVSFGGTGVILSRKGVDTASVTVTEVSTRAVVDVTDYDLVKTNDLGGQDYTVEISATAENSLPDPTLVFVTYQYTDVDYYEPKRVGSFEDVKNLYGEPLNLTEGSSFDPNYVFVTSPLSLAAKVAFENGASEIITVPATPSTGSASAISSGNRASLKEAMDKTLSLAGVNVVVPVTSGILTADAAGVITDTSAHIEAAVLDGYPRSVVVGFGAEVTTAPDALLQASGVVNRRLKIAYAQPGGLLMYSSGVNGNFQASHTYLAAAYAGKMSSLPVQRSLTRQPLSSFSGLSGSLLTTTLKNQYAQSGITVAEVNRVGRLVVRDDTTTDRANANTRNPSVVRARDAMVTLIRNGFEESGLIGEPIDEDLIYAVKATMSGYLEESVATETIVAYSGLGVRQRPNNPEVIEIQFSYRPAYPLQYIAITFSIDMTTGVAEDLDAA